MRDKIPDRADSLLYIVLLAADREAAHPLAHGDPPADASGI